MASLRQQRALEFRLARLSDCGTSDEISLWDASSITSTSSSEGSPDSLLASLEEAAATSAGEEHLAGGTQPRASSSSPEPSDFCASEGGDSEGEVMAFAWSLEGPKELVHFEDHAAASTATGSRTTSLQSSRFAGESVDGRQSEAWAVCSSRQLPLVDGLAASALTVAAAAAPSGCDLLVCAALTVAQGPVDRHHRENVGQHFDFEEVFHCSAGEMSYHPGEVFDHLGAGEEVSHNFGLEEVFRCSAGERSHHPREVFDHLGAFHLREEALGQAPSLSSRVQCWTRAMPLWWLDVESECEATGPRAEALLQDLSPTFGERPRSFERVRTLTRTKSLNREHFPKAME